jgi:hypothetical protein
LLHLLSWKLLSHFDDRDAPSGSRRGPLPKTHASEIQLKGNVREKLWEAVREHVEPLLAAAAIRLDGSRPWDVLVHDDRLFVRPVRGGSLAADESYVEGWWDWPKLDEMFVRIYQGRIDERLGGRFGNWDRLKGVLLRLVTGLRGRFETSPLSPRLCGGRAIVFGTKRAVLKSSSVFAFSRLLARAQLVILSGLSLVAFSLRRDCHGGQTAGPHTRCRSCRLQVLRTSR